MSSVTLRYEQAVYGSFPFWDKGYAVLARSPGCRDEWIADLRAACQRYGERPAGAADAGGVIALKLPSGPWAIIAPLPQGMDDRGRPGAVAFHALFVSGADYRKAGAFPFAFVPLFRHDWSAETTTLETGEFNLEQVIPAEPISPKDPLARRIAETLMRGKRVALETSASIETLARDIYQALPLTRRARVSVSTWSFGNGNRYDLVALPRLHGVAFDRSYVDPSKLTADDSAEQSFASTSPRTIPARWLWAGVALLAALPILALAVRTSRESNASPAVTTQPAINPTELPPARPNHPAELPNVTRRRVEEGLVGLAERFGVLDGKLSADDLKPRTLMTRLRERLTYNGPLLSASQLADLEKTADGPRLHGWHDHLLHFLPDRALPADFTDGPLDWQLQVLAWTFHVDLAARPLEEWPAHLAESLSPPFVVRSSSLEDTYPPLVEYAKFLRRLPRR